MASFPTAALFGAADQSVTHESVTHERAAASAWPPHAAAQTVGADAPWTTAPEPVLWLLDALAPDSQQAALDAWSGARGLAGLPAGYGWDVIRVTQKCGMDVIETLESEGCPIGPLLFNARSWSVEFLVPAGTADTWRGPLSVSSGRHDRGVLWCPRPGSTRGQRTWLRLPDGHLTEPNALRNALVRAEFHHNSGPPDFGDRRVP